MDKEYIKSIWAAFQEVQEKKEKKMDPVGQEDDDIDNDGDTDSTDKYLLNRRKAISKAMKKEEAEQIDEISKEKAADYHAKSVQFQKDALRSNDPKKLKKIGNRLIGVDKANKITGKTLPEEVELDEVSKDDEQTVHKMLNSHSAENLLKAHKKLYGKEYPGTSKSELVSKIKSKVRNYKHAYELMKEEVELDEDAVVTHKWYSVKHWKDGSDHFDNLDNHLHGMSYKHSALGNTARNRPDHHIGIPVKAKKAIAYMDKHAKQVNEAAELDEAADDTRMGTITITTDAQRKARAQAYRDKKAKEAMKKEEVELDEADRSKHYKGATAPEAIDSKDSPGGKQMKADLTKGAKYDDTEEKGHMDALKAGRTGPSAAGDAHLKGANAGDKKIIPSATKVREAKTFDEFFKALIGGEDD